MIISVAFYTGSECYFHLWQQFKTKYTGNYLIFVNKTVSSHEY